MWAWKSLIAVSAMSALLPDARAFFRRNIECLTGLHSEGRIPGVDIGDDTVDAILAIAVRIAGGEVSDRFRGHLPSPDLRPTHTHTLVASQPVDDLRALA